MNDARGNGAAQPASAEVRKKRFDSFARLHVPGDPVVLYNIWDAGSALAVARAGAKAIATGSHPVADANGWPDGEKVPIDFVFANATRIVQAVDLPVTIDFEGGYAVEPELAARNVAALAETGAVGCNFEDQVIGGEGVHPLALQCRRIEAIRRALGDGFFINARTDLMLKVKEHDGALIDQVIERGRAFADAGASGFFVPRLSDPRQVERVVKAVPLPLNLIAFPGAPPKAQWADAGAARISHGPFPLRALMARFEEMARTAIA
ncbi:MAG TPA: isocitrate lyase/phosphoenolpyruvate mutase family protein [Sphingomicrobium sp.]|nr:isocitrate lyase/phosphoenolpyruvate mutase family protein [Sphingomicrobium sp.]